MMFELRIESIGNGFIISDTYTGNPIFCKTFNQAAALIQRRIKTIKKYEFS